MLPLLGAYTDGLEASRSGHPAEGIFEEERSLRADARRSAGGLLKPDRPPDQRLRCAAIPVVVVVQLVF